MIANMASAFGVSAPAEQSNSKKDIDKLPAKIGQLLVERNFLWEVSNFILDTGGRKR